MNNNNWKAVETVLSRSKPFFLFFLFCDQISFMRESVVLKTP